MAPMAPTPMLQNYFYLLEQVKKNLVGGVTDRPRDRAWDRAWDRACGLDSPPSPGEISPPLPNSIIYHLSLIVSEPRRSVFSCCIVRPSLHMSILIAL